MAHGVSLRCTRWYGARVQEFTYPEFCEALVRIAHRRFGDLPTLESRLRCLVTQHLLPQQQQRPHAITTLMAGREFAQYFATVDAVMRITFTASCKLSVGIRSPGRALYGPLSMVVGHVDHVDCIHSGASS